MWKSLILPFLAPVSPVDFAQGADEVNVSKGGTLAGPGLAAHGYDVVALFTEGSPTIGSDAYAIAYGGGTYRFASQANLDAFKANPSKYEPAYGGFCAYGVALGKKFDGDPRFWKIVDGRLYLNLNGNIQSEWSKDVASNIAKADTNWGRIRASRSRGFK
jgi:YHS domain-containing protein